MNNSLIKLFLNFLLSGFMCQSLYAAISSNLQQNLQILQERFQILEEQLNQLKTPILIQQQKMFTHELWKKIAEGQINFGSNKKTKIDFFKETVKKAQSENTKIPQKTDNIFRIMTYNIHYFKNPEDTLSNKEQILTIIQHINPDVIIFQELSPEAGFGVGGNLENSDLYKTFNAMGYNFIASCNTIKNGWFGNVIASKVKPIEQKQITFQTQTGLSEKRCYVYMKITLPKINQPIELVGTHLEVFGKDVEENFRLPQIQEILKSNFTTKNNLITADFNAIRKEDYQYAIAGKNIWDLVQNENKAVFNIDTTPTLVIDELNSHGYQNSFSYLKWQGPKFTTWTGTVIDFIMLAPTWNLPLAGSYIYYDAASDHLPIIMDIKLD